MTAKDRKTFLLTFLPGIVLLVGVYILATTLREVRDGFMADMWRASGEAFEPGVFAKTETLISLAILVLIASMVVIRNNLKAFLLAQWIVLAGFVFSGAITWLYLQGNVSTFTWMTLVGLGLYMSYIPYNSILFDRMLAAYRYAANVGFLIYVADSFGYLASVSVLLTKTIFKLQVNWLGFYINLVLFTAVIGGLFTLFSIFYFRRKYKSLVVVPEGVLAAKPSVAVL